MNDIGKFGALWVARLNPGAAGRMSEITAQHIDPVWQTIAGYLLDQPQAGAPQVEEVPVDN